MSALNKKGKCLLCTGAPTFLGAAVAVPARTVNAGPDARGEGRPAVSMKKNPETIKSFRAAIDEGLAFIKANPDEAKEIERKYIGFNSPRFPTFENRAKPDDL